MKNNRKAWTAKEENYLAENRNMPIKTLMKELERTKGAIKQKIISLKKKGIIKYIERKPRKAHEIFQWEKRDPETR